MAKAKVAKQDFLEENLPQTRKDQFFDLLKNNYKSILQAGLMLLLFFLPILAMNLFKSVMSNKAFALIELGEATEAEVIDAIAVNNFIVDAVNIILYPVLFLGIAGVLRVVRQLVFGEPVVFKYDFNKGIKNNFRQFLLIGLFVSLLKLIIDFIIFGFHSSLYIEIAAYAIFYCFFLPPFIVLTVYETIYDNKFFTSLKHSFLLYLRGSWKFLGIILTFVIPFILLEEFLNYTVIRQIIYGVLIVFVLPLVMIIGFMIMFSTFDKLINIRLYPEIWRKGLYVSEQEKEEMTRTKVELEKLL